jgi:hypothetical protein
MEVPMRMKSVLVAALCAVAAAAVGAGSAFAGEVTGKGKPTAAPAHAQSICAFSGQNDGEPPPGRTAEHVQNWGQIPKAERDVIATEGSHPGDACNGHTGFLAGGGGE